MEYVRSWKVGDRTFTNKEAAQKYEAELTLSKYGTVDQLIANADAVIEALRPFATPRPRKAKGNGATVKKSAKAAQVEAAA